VATVAQRVATVAKRVATVAKRVATVAKRVATVAKRVATVAKRVATVAIWWRRSRWRWRSPIAVATCQAYDASGDHRQVANPYYKLFAGRRH
jgi:hypothetical protein